MGHCCRLVSHLRGGLREGCPLEALQHLAPELAGIVHALEELRVLLHPGAAEGVVDAAHACAAQQVRFWGPQQGDRKALSRLALLQN